MLVSMYNSVENVLYTGTELRINIMTDDCMVGEQGGKGVNHHMLCDQDN